MCTEDVELTVHPHFDVVAIVDEAVDAQDLSVSLRCRTETGWTWRGGGYPDADGLVHFREVAREGCALVTRRLHGSVELTSERVPVRATTEPQEILVDVPPLPATGLGGYPDREGARIDAIAPGSRGERAGLELRDLVFPQEETDLSLEAWLDSDEPLPVWVERDGERFETVI